MAVEEALGALAAYLGLKHAELTLLFKGKS
jgi:hypothetical protein